MKRVLLVLFVLLSQVSFGQYEYLQDSDCTPDQIESNHINFTIESAAVKHYDVMAFQGGNAYLDLKDQTELNQNLRMNVYYQEHDLYAYPILKFDAVVPMFAANGSVVTWIPLNGYAINQKDPIGHTCSYDILDVAGTYIMGLTGGNQYGTWTMTFKYDKAGGKWTTASYSLTLNGMSTLISFDREGVVDLGDTFDYGE